ncbi:SPBc2 prophage-derived endonuclease YokF precursor [Methyloligella halotolerans]|uniref:SPBc2 prophage-derived endonuclease YokF n=1 Tax=Methyloligella halotolerans TaxID=1177755 RepID=A0A1E2RUY1_9HYPH|nr:thermonuclease family protein [Methyloligella halotolerans]ODA66057.1 SPBc2 prophage-derived endonuclease YokF precursor [Methyloligella halotolerans]
MGLRRCFALGLIVVFCWHSALLGAEGAPGCELSEPEQGTVVEIVDGETLKLADGGTVRLVGAKAPRPPASTDEGDWAYSRKAIEALESLTKGKTVSLRFGGSRTDRHGYLMAQVFVAPAPGEDPVWVQEALVGDGLARVYSLPDNAACTDALLEREEGARAARRGLWASGFYGVRDAGAVDRMRRLRGTFQLVEGRVAKVAQVKDWVFLNFDEDWREDFTVAIEKKQAKAFAEAGFDLLALEGKPVRVRGWLEWRYGPSIKATHLEQIEVLEDDGEAEAPPPP